MATDQTRLFVARIPYDVRQRELEDIFSRYGPIRSFTLKKTYGFIEYDYPEDAREAEAELDGFNLGGQRLIVEFATGRKSDREMDRIRDYGTERGDSRERDGGGYRGRRGGYADDVGSYRSHRPPPSGRFSPPHNTQFRVIVEGVPPGCSWQDLKDHFRKVGDVCFVDVRRSRDGGSGGGVVGRVEFKYYEDVDRAIREMDRTYFRGSMLSVFDDCPDSVRRSRSPPPPPSSTSSSSYRSDRRPRSRSLSPRRASPRRSPPRGSSPRSGGGGGVGGGGGYPPRNGNRSGSPY
eukprot:TRINITY_DN10170_c0_g1_i3.p1 TRINITY_DN10170_c0_g1~~TRINITY_DN10170_c0_g1_i3.p1  ORF type:complete len:292 (-),score=44.88 TRINITY_DN10170_c0_g1_i3:254-1129(-)